MKLTLHAQLLAVLASLLPLAAVAATQAPAMPQGGWKLSNIDLRGRDREAAIVFEFTVKADGSLADIAPVAGFHDAKYVLYLTQAVRTQKMVPASVDGKPVDFHGYRMLLQITLPSVAATGPGFGQRYQQATALVKAGQPEAAAKAIEEMIAGGISSNFEFAFLQAALVPIYAQLGRNHDALLASQLATLHNGPQQAFSPTGMVLSAKPDPRWGYILARDVVPNLLRQQFMLAVALQDSVSALSAHAQLAAIAPLPDDDPVAIRARTLQQRALSLEPIIAPVQLAGGTWSYRPMRRVVALADVQGGALKSVRLHCAFHQQDMPAVAGESWVLKPEWGDCVLALAGDPGTRLNVRETSAAP